MARTAWVERWTLDGWPVWDDGGTDLRQLDRFGCRWEDGVRVGYGPACLPLEPALRWAAATAAHTVVAAVDGRWNPHGEVRMPRIDEGWSVAWDHLPALEWTVTARVRPGPRAFAEADWHRADPEDDPVTSVLHVEADPDTAGVLGVVAVRAATAALAGDIGAHHLRRVLTPPEGLPDERGELLPARVESVTPARLRVPPPGLGPGA